MLRTLTLSLLLSCCLMSYTQIKHCEVNKYNTYISINGKKLVKTIEVEIKINTAKGTNEAEIDIHYVDDSDIKDISASIESINGKEIKKLRKKDIEYSNAYSHDTFHSNDKVMSFALIHNRYPHILKYSYTRVIGSYVSLVNWIPLYDNNIDIKTAKLEITLPKDFKFKSIENKIDSSYSVNAGDDITYGWIVTYPENTERQNYAPPVYSILPRVEIVPEKFQYGIEGSTQSWATYGEWHHQLNQTLGELTLEEKLKVHQLTDHLNSDEEKVKVLYHYMQDNTRYINVSLELGGLIPHPASYVCRNKYGDCKALSNYMKALLNQVGIKSLYTTVYADTNPISVDTANVSQQFNHVILCVPQKKDTIWLECTDNTAPFNYLGTSTQNRMVLAVDAKESKLIKTRALSLSDCTNTYKTTVQVNPNGESNLELHASIRAGLFEFLKGFEKDIPESRMADIIDRTNLMQNGDINTINITRPHRDSSYVDLELNARVINMAERIGSKLLIRPVQSFTMKLDKPQKRTQSISLAYPRSRIDSTHYILNQEIAEVSGKADIKVNSAYGTYEKQIIIKGNKLTIVRNISISSGTYEIDEYDSFYQFINEMNRYENEKLLITTK